MMTYTKQDTPHMSKLHRDFLHYTTIANSIALLNKRYGRSQFHMFPNELNSLLPFYNSLYERTANELSIMHPRQMVELKQSISNRIANITDCYGQHVDKKKWNFAMFKISNGLTHVRQNGTNAGNFVTTEFEILEDLVHLFEAHKI